MKVHCFIIGLLLAVVAQAAVITAPTNYGPQLWNCLLGKTLATDTIKGIDTVVYFRKQAIDPGYVYTLAIKNIHTDSSAQKVEMLVYGSDGSTLMRTMLVDTVQGIAAATTTRYIDLPIGKTVLSQLITLQGIGFVADSLQRPVRVELWRSKLNMKP